MVATWAPQAEQDLIDIYLESVRQFGTMQAERYVAEVVRVMHARRDWEREFQ